MSRQLVIDAGRSLREAMDSAQEAKRKLEEAGYELTADEVDRDIRSLKKRIERIQAMVSQGV